MKIFDNEKANWSQDKASLSLFDAGRSFFVYYRRQFKKLNSGGKKLKVLDVGCGSGGITKSLKQSFPDFTFSGCDISKSAIYKANQEPEGIGFSVANAQKLPYKNNEFDVVIMDSVLDHLEKPEKAVKEAFRVLKRKGIYLSATPLEADLTTLHGYLSQFKGFRRHRYQYCGHIHAFSRRNLKLLIQGSGFKVEEVNYDWFYFAQIVDLFYYAFLSLLQKSPQFSLNMYSKENKSFLGKAVKFIRIGFNLVENIESVITYKIPLGFFMYVKAVKK